MYKIDDEFRPPGRVFVKAMQENPDHITSTSTPTTSRQSVEHYKTNLKRYDSNKDKGSAITTNLDERNIRYKHEVKHEKTVEAIIREYPGSPGYSTNTANISKSINDISPIERNIFKEISVEKSGGGDGSISTGTNLSQSPSKESHHMETVKYIEQIPSPGILSTVATTTTTTPDGNRQITTSHIVRKMTRMHRAEEKTIRKGLHQSHTKNVRTTEIGYLMEEGNKPKRTKVLYYRE